MYTRGVSAGCAHSGGRQVEEQRLGQQGRVSEEVRRLRHLLVVVVLVVLLEHEGGRGRRPRAQQRRERPQQRVLLLLLLMRLQLRGAHVAQLAPARQPTGGPLVVVVAHLVHLQHCNAKLNVAISRGRMEFLI